MLLVVLFFFSTTLYKDKLFEANCCYSTAVADPIKKTDNYSFFVSLFYEIIFPASEEKIDFFITKKIATRRHSCKLLFRPNLEIIFFNIIMILNVIEYFDGLKR